MVTTGLWCGRGEEGRRYPSQEHKALQKVAWCAYTPPVRHPAADLHSVSGIRHPQKELVTMPHIHDKIDFTVAIFVVQQGRVLLVHHRALDKWLPLGGHIELDEDPEQAALREAREESGLEVELLGERPPTTEPGTRALLAPRFLDIHRISATHEHIGMIYLARPRHGTTALQLATSEHHAIRWCTQEELCTLFPPLSGAVQWYCEQALREVQS